MGGCYNYDYKKETKKEIKKEPGWKEKVKTSFNNFLKTGDNKEIVEAYKAFFNENKSGVFAEFAKLTGIKNVSDIPKEFPEIEYEVKFDITPVPGKGDEPGLLQYLDAFDFPATNSARFLKDPVNIFSIGVNRFYGDSSDERLVVIDKGGGLYLKEKGLVTTIDAPVKNREIVIKRTEKRWQSSLDEVLSKIENACLEKGVCYQGKIRKEKADVFMLDTNDGRIYSFTMTRAHLVKPNENFERDIQRQLEIEYAGHLSGFPGFKMSSEEQIVSGMVDLSKYTYALYNNCPVANGWRMGLNVTDERKYDFITGKEKNNFRNNKSLIPSISNKIPTKYLFKE